MPFLEPDRRRWHSSHLRISRHHGITFSSRNPQWISTSDITASVTNIKAIMHTTLETTKNVHISTPNNGDIPVAEINDPGASHIEKIDHDRSSSKRSNKSITAQNGVSILQLACYRFGPDAFVSRLHATIDLAGEPAVGAFECVGVNRRCMADASGCAGRVGRVGRVGPCRDA